MAVAVAFSNSGFIAGASDDGSLILATWVLTTADPTGLGVPFPEWADCTVHAEGTWGGATLTWQGSNTDVDAKYNTLSNAAGGAGATWTADGVKSITELPVFMRPKLTSAGSGASITVTLLKRRANPLRT